jgi:hypothetical protein
LLNEGVNEGEGEGEAAAWGEGWLAACEDEDEAEWGEEEPGGVVLCGGEVTGGEDEVEGEAVVMEAAAGAGAAVDPADEGLPTALANAAE